MGLKEKLIGIDIQKPNTDKKPLPNSEVLEVYNQTGIEDLLKEFLTITPYQLETVIVEKGEKMLLVLEWPCSTYGNTNGIRISFRKDAVSFISAHDDQYTRLQGHNIRDKNLIEDAFVKAIKDGMTYPIIPRPQFASRF